MTTQGPSAALHGHRADPQRTGSDPVAPGDSGRGRWPTIDRRYLAPLLITLILLGGNAAMGILESVWKTGLAIAVAMVLEVVLSRTVRGVWPNLASPYISGISIGILVRSPYLWPFAFGAAISILSKYAIRIRGRHIFNPSNFAIVMLILFASDTVAVLSIQWDNRMALMIPIWAVGLFVLLRLKRLHISLTYAGSFIAFAALRGMQTGHGFVTEVAPLTGPMYQLFTLFMVTDPPTTVRSRRGQILVAFLVAFVEHLLRLAHVVYAPFYALFMVGPLALLFSWFVWPRLQSRLD